MIHKRKDYRLKNYDYSSPNAYFITICTKDRHPILWQSVSHNNVGAAIGRPVVYELSPYGKVAETAINKISSIYPTVNVDKYVIMPNHIHMILSIHHIPDTISPSTATIVNQLKGYISKQLGFSPWQKLYHDRIIRNEEEYLNKWQYIEDNPLKWSEDDEYVNLQTFQI
ncbi:MAG: transposase [Clostridia bacterium]|nr:transposase [Clostridia bacterium]